VYACNYGFNPGGMNIPSGACESIGFFYIPFLVLYLFAIFGGPIGFIVPSIIAISICTGVGGLIGWLIDRKQKKSGISIVTKNIVYVSLAILFLLLIVSTLFVYMDRKEYISNLRAEHKAMEEFKEEISFLNPKWLPGGVEKYHIDNEIQFINRTNLLSVFSHWMYICNNRYSLKITISRSEYHQEGRGWRDPRYGRREEEVKIGSTIGKFSYFDQNTTTNNPHFDKYIKQNRQLSWDVQGFHIKVEKDQDRACIFSKEELIKIAESMDFSS